MRRYCTKQLHNNACSVMYADLPVTTRVASCYTGSGGCRQRVCDRDVYFFSGCMYKPFYECSPYVLSPFVLVLKNIFILNLVTVPPLLRTVTEIPVTRRTHYHSPVLHDTIRVSSICLNPHVVAISGTPSVRAVQLYRTNVCCNEFNTKRVSYDL